MSRFRQFNANYWNRSIDDCTIRALSFGTGYGYFHVVKMLRLQYKLGIGMTEDGVDIDHIVNVFTKKGILEEVYVDRIYWNYFTGKRTKKDQFIDPEVGETVHEFGSMYGGTGRYILFLRPGPNSVEDGPDWHCIYFNSDANMYFDTWDSGRYILFGAYRIKTEKVPDDDPYSRKSEREKIRQYIKTKDKSLLKF